MGFVLVADRPGLNIKPLLWRLLADPVDDSVPVVWDRNAEPDGGLVEQARLFNVKVVRDEPCGHQLPADLILAPGADPLNYAVGEPTALALFVDEQGGNACSVVVKEGSAWLPRYDEKPDGAVRLTSPASDTGVWLAGEIVWASKGDSFIKMGPPPSCLLTLSGSWPEPSFAEPTVAHKGLADLWATQLVHCIHWGDWVGAGKALDQSWKCDHEACPADPQRDLKYAAARSLGAWGGRPTPAGLMLLADPSLYGELCEVC